jgi:hypothetical protein
VITEVFAHAKNPPGAPRWFELFNASDAPLQLDGAELGHQLAGSNTFYGHYVSSLSIPPSAYAAVGDASPDELPAYLAYGYGDDLGALDDETAGGTLSVRCGSLEIASTTYSQYVTGHASALGAGAAPTPARASDPANWCQANDAMFVTDNYGTPGAPTDCVPQGQCVAGDSPRAITTPAVGQLVISELMTEPLKAPRANGAWFEATALAAFDLNDLTLGRASTSTKPEPIATTDCLTVDDGDHVVFAKTTDPTQNGGLPGSAIAWTFSFSLVEGSDSAPGDVEIRAGNTVIDSVTWTGSLPGASWQLDPSVIGGSADVDANSWCPSYTTYGLGDFGTPGAPNVPCAGSAPSDAGVADAAADAATIDAPPP